ncbi:MAG: NAD(P)/FAD-dependent oxidoreductase [Dehalococcoidia bacterium]
MPTEDITIIGAGPAGIATAIQLTRWGLEPLLLEKDRAGGLLVNANLVENYPGFPEGVSGAALASLFISQLERVGGTIRFEQVTELDYRQNFLIKTADREFESRIVVVASGTKPRTYREIAIPKDAAHKVFYEVHPIAEVKGKRIVIIGAGDAAFDYALNLARENRVTILNRGTRRKCIPLLRERAGRTEAITYLEKSPPSSITNSGDHVLVSGQNAGGYWELEADYVILAIGREPWLDFISGEVEESASGLEGEGRLHFVGDVKNDIYRQASIAVGDGVHAAMKICRMLEGAS